MKRKTIKQLKDKLWSLFAPYIKDRDRGICKACGRMVSGQNYHAGHLLPKSICGVVLAFHPYNVWGECGNCNIWASGNGALLNINVSKVVGYDVATYLQAIRLKTKDIQWERKHLETLIEVLTNNPEDYAFRHKQIYEY